MPVPWKLIGVAGLAGVAVGGVVVARQRRAHEEYDPDDLRDRLHDRLAANRGGPGTAPEPSAASEPSSGR